MIKKLNRVIIGSGFIAKKFKKHQNFLKIAILLFMQLGYQIL